MSHGRGKDDLLGETAKTYLRELWIKEVFGREKYDTVNKYTIKGIMVESDSLQLVSDLTKKSLFKNTKFLENAFVCGTPDVTEPLIDIKSSWDIWSFFNVVDEKKARADYYWQLVGYMNLLRRRSSRLIYVLVDTPPEISSDELYRLSYKLNEEQVKKAENTFIYSDIEPKYRIKVFKFTMGKKERIELENQVIAARDYLVYLDCQLQKNIKLRL
jgi:hypothetical protein